MVTFPAQIRFKKTYVLLALVAALWLCALGFYLSRPDSKSNTNSVPANPELPTRLTIPKINVNAQIEHVGLTPEQDMDVPKGADNAAWYQLGPRPGESGSAVIDAHFDRDNGKPGVFYNLNTLKAGDKVSVKDESGTTITFIVRESKKYDPAADAKEVFKSTDGRAHLNLITCSGDWNTAEQSYSNRLVVFTEKES